MGPEHHLLFGILAYQNGFVSRAQLLTAVDQWLQDKSQPIDQVLLHHAAIEPDELRVLQDLIERLLLKQDERESLIRTIGSDTNSLLAELRRRDDEDIHNTIGPVATPGTAQARPPEKVRQAGPRFKILRPHDEGGLGKVSVALDTELDREVALKEILPRYADDPASRARFLLEAEITGGLEHPGIVPIYGLGASADGRPYYAMRFIKGDNLSAAIKQFHEETDEADRAVGMRRLLGRFLDVCNAVYYAHQRGVLHRDLKPGNVMLGEYGETLVVDWGLAKSIDQSESQSTSVESMAHRETPLQPRSGSAVAATQLGSAIGSPHYMSPEQARGENDRLGIAADVYSLGATLYTLLTNRKPVEGESIQEILENVQFGNRLSARRQNPHIDPALSAICERAMAMEPSERYGSVRRLAEDIERHLADEPVQAYREPFGRRTKRWVRKHPRTVASLAATAVAGVVSVALIAGVVANSNRQLGEKNVELADLNQTLGGKNVELADLNQSLEQSRSEAVQARDDAVLARDDAVQARDQARDVTNFLIEAFRSPDPTRGGRDLKVVNLLDYSLRNLEDRFEGVPTTKAALLDALGKTYRGLGLPHKSVRLCEEALKLRQEHLGPDDQQTLSSMNTLALAYANAGHAEKALALYKETLKLSQNKPDADLYEILQTMDGLAGVQLRTGNAHLAVALLEETIELARKKKESADHPGTLTVMSHLASAYLAIGLKDKALALNKESYELLVEKLGEENPFTLSALNRLATSYKAVGQAERAIALFEKTLNLRRQKLGPDHPDTLGTMYDLARAYGAAGQFEKSAEILEETVKQMRRYLGAAHPHTRGAMKMLILAYTKTGHPHKAATFFEDELKRTQELHGPEHSETFRIMFYLADLYGKTGRKQDAKALWEKAYRMAQEKLGNTHSVTVRALNGLAYSHYNLGDARQAIALHKTNLRLCQAELGEEHVDTQSAMRGLARAYFAHRDLEEAAALFEKLIQLSRTTGNPTSDPLENTLKLARCYQFLAKHSAACSLLEDFYLKFSEELGVMDRLTGRAFIVYRSALLLANENSKAIELCQDRMDAERQLGEKNLVNNHAAMAEALLALGKLDEAIRAAQESLASATTLDPNTNFFWWAHSILGSAYARQNKWQQADEHLRLAETIVDENKTRLTPFDWHRAHRIYRDLDYVHREWQDSTESQKWQAALTKFEIARAYFDPLNGAMQQK